MIKKILSCLVLFVALPVQAIEDCSHGVNFSNGNTYKNLTAKVICHDRDNPSIKSSETNLVEGIKHGKTILYDAFLRTVGPEDKTGKIYRIENYDNGKLHGEVKTFDAQTGNLITTQEYRNKKEISSKNEATNQTTFHGYTLDPKSYQKSTLIKDGNDSIISLRCMEIPTDNKEINRYCGFIDSPGPTIKITNSGITSQIHYCKGKPCGKSLQTYGNGNTASEKFTTKDGKIVSRQYNEKGVLTYEHTRSKDAKEEQVIENFDSGQPKEIITLHNHIPLEITTYYQNGQKRYHAKASGKEIVNATSYYDSGHKSEEYQFKRYSNSLISRGRLINTSRKYYESGEIHRENTWKDDYIEHMREFDINGNVIKDERYYSDGSRMNQ